LSKALAVQKEEDMRSGVACGTSEEFPEVHAFLKSIALEGKYYELFVDNGIEDIETVLELNDQHLDALSIPLGYKLKILKQIKSVRQGKGMQVPESRQGQRSESQLSVKELSAQKSNLKKEEKPKKSVVFEEKEHPERGKKSDNLGDGQFDEDESH
jgi:hypothetical protein